VGNTSAIEVPPPTKASKNLTNSIVDSGTNSLTMDDELFKIIADRLGTANDKELTQFMRAGYVPMNSLNLSKWPSITFVVQGNAGDVKLVVTPENYWQTNAPEKGYASAAIFSDNGQLNGQSILGLPLMNGYFTIFDRSVDKGLGVIKFASRK
jgi:Eukaryotic aspartyl protease